ncbi:MAG: DUF1304 domain-containing protein [Flavobacteriales bacterium]
MNILALILTGLVIVEHIYFLYIEMFAWETIGKKTFKNFPPHLFEPTKALAANQGLYNGFLAAGLIWTFLIDDAAWSTNIRFFFLGCVVVAGVYGAITASKKILTVQAVPAILATIATYLAQ